MKQILFFVGIITLLTTGCVVREGGHGHARFEHHDTVVVGPPVVVVRPPPVVVVRPPVVIVH
ncbi:MAG: hypothetical protein EXS18_07750 [Verrucomicrobiae bacterium]|nr:hypothetical protein [Verrucomicrobiae bacterium]